MKQTRSVQDFIEEKIRLLSTCGSVLDVGGGERFQKWLSPYRTYFDKVDYKTFDYDARSGADVVGDIHNIPLPEASVDGIICHSVLEHVADPMQATREMYRILKPGGALFLHVPSIYPYHARKGSYPDYWRFFDDTFAILLAEFTDVELVKRGGYFTALSFFVPSQHRLRWFLDPLSVVLDRIFKTERRTTTAGYYVYAIKPTN